MTPPGTLVAPAKGMRPSAGLGVSATLTPTPTPAPSYPQAEPIEQKKPVVIHSEKLLYNDKLQETRFVGKVRARQGDTTLKADELDTHTAGQEAQVTGHVVLADTRRKILLHAGQADYLGQMDVVHLKDGVVLHTVDPYGLPVTVTSQTGEYARLSETARLEGDVLVLRRNVTATASTAYYRGAEGLLLLQRKARVHSGRNHFWADQIQFFRPRDLVTLDGQVKAVFVPSELQKLEQTKGRE
jgi:lipopolysaccharide export system protein LptA